MARNIAIGIGAGLAAALLYVGVLTGSLLALPLSFLSPLPIAIAGLSFGTRSGVAAVLAAAALIGVGLGPTYGALYLLLYGAPAAWGSHMIGLARDEAGRPDAREWFPLDRILVRLAWYFAAAAIACGVLAGFDRAEVATVISAMLHAMFDGGAAGEPTTGEIDTMARWVVAFLPMIMSGLPLILAVFNLWLGARVSRVSNHLARPWKPLWAVPLPRSLVPFLVVAILGCFLPGVPGLVIGTVAGGLGAAFALTGYGCLHALLQGKPAKAFVLSAVYVGSLFFAPAIFAAAALGVADCLLNIRGRRLAPGSGNP